MHLHLSSLFLTFLATVSLTVGAMAGQKPNIIYILLDDAGYGDLSCYGQEKFQTPHIDRLAREGMKFTNHYAGSTVCAPTRSVIMSGLHTGHTASRGNREIRPVGQFPIPASTFTIAEALKKAGYATGAFGKWGLGNPGSEGDPIHQGFDRFFGYNCQRNAHTYYPTWLFDDLRKIELDGKTYAHDLIMDRAVEWIDRNHEGPFFCFLPVTIPHAAMHVPEKYAAPFRKKFPEFENKVGRYGNNRPFAKNPAAQFAGMMTALDHGIGRVLESLEEHGIDKDTIILLSSDNGPHKEGGHMPDYFNSGGGLRGHKRDLYEGGIRCPLLVRWPGKVKAGSTSDHISAHWDLFPTFCELADTDLPQNLDGISFLSTLLGKPQKQHDYLYWEFFEGGGKRAVRIGKWKAVQNQVNRKGQNAPIEIYDLENDRAETSNLAAQSSELITRVRRIFKEAHTPSPLWKFKWEQ
ncbi:MAG: N-acetylgalactosamine-6-sulfatase [Verrucomicrobiaceae bacterium]|nr:N-acetylgalactosamine-6-sulfatase [Verrucomicrobiaceae bacterium]